MTTVKKLPDQQKLAAQRTHLANERTLMAYTRTCLSLIGFGVIILRFDPSPSAPLLGYGCIAASAIVMAIGFRRFYVHRERINNDDAS